MDYLILIVGLAALILSGEILVRGAVQLALHARISPLVVGLTVISFGTSLPELLVSLQAALGGHPDVASGNVVGSNSWNIGLVLAVTAIIFPIVVERDTLRIDYPVMMGATALFCWCIWDGLFVWWEGALFVVLLIVYNGGLIRYSRKTNKEADVEVQADSKSPPWWSSGVKLLAGFVGLYIGAQLLVNGAVSLAHQWGMSERVIGTTIVAFCTSAPELATSAMAAFRKQADISIGNLIGSNVFNILAIFGITGLFTDIPINPNLLAVDVRWMVGLSLLLGPLIFLGRNIGRWKGAVLLVVFVSYMYTLLAG